MRKIKYILLLAGLLIFSNAQAQLGLKASYATMKNPFYNLAGQSNGLTIGATYNFTESIRVEALYGALFRRQYDNYLETSPKTDYTIMPMTIGADYSFKFGNVRPFIGINLGAIRKSYVYDVNPTVFNQVNTYFTIAPKFGLDFKVTDFFFVEVVMRAYVIDNQKFENAIKKPDLSAEFGIVFLPFVK